LSFSEVREQLSPEDVRLKKLWIAIGEHPISRDEAETRINEAAGQWEGDGAFAGAQLTILESMGAVSVAGDTVTRSDEFPQLPDLTPGTQAYNDAKYAEEREARAREIESENETYARAYENSPAGRERRELLELVDARVDERIRELVREGKLSATA
jgi:hypothetical protein